MYIWGRFSFKIKMRGDYQMGQKIINGWLVTVTWKVYLS